MKKVLYLAFVAMVVLFASCKEEHTTPINAIAKACFAPGGNNSYWEYHDGRSVTERDFTVTLTDYEEYQNSCDERKVYSEAINYKLNGEACTVYSYSCTQDGTAHIQVAIPHSEALYLECDADGNYNCKAHDVFPTYDVNNITYENVHYFEVELGSDIYHYYFAEGYGLIYMYDDQQKVQLKANARPVIR